MTDLTQAQIIAELRAELALERDRHDAMRTVYQSCVRGRMEFRQAYRDCREAKREAVALLRAVSNPANLAVQRDVQGQIKKFLENQSDE